MSVLFLSLSRSLSLFNNNFFTTILYYVEYIVYVGWKFLLNFKPSSQRAIVQYSSCSDMNVWVCSLIFMPRKFQTQHVVYDADRQRTNLRLLRRVISKRAFCVGNSTVLYVYVCASVIWASFFCMRAYMLVGLVGFVLSWHGEWTSGNGERTNEREKEREDNERKWILKREKLPPKKSGHLFVCLMYKFMKRYLSKPQKSSLTSHLVSKKERTRENEREEVSMRKADRGLSSRERWWKQAKWQIFGPVLKLADYSMLACCVYVCIYERIRCSTHEHRAFRVLSYEKRYSFNSWK